MDKGEAIAKVKQYSNLLKQHMQFDKIYLFGSFAKETNREDSDIDVAILVNKLDGDFFSIHPLLWKLRRQIDDRIEPIIIEMDFDDADFYKEIQNHGIQII
jgi:predicted nucleotidyltransferase